MSLNSYLKKVYGMLYVGVHSILQYNAFAMFFLSITQGSFAPWKSWNTLDFYCSSAKPLKALEF